MGYMVCNKSRNNSITYSWNTDDPTDCGGTVNTKELYSFENHFNLFPNPIRNNVTVISLEEMGFKMAFFNLQGIELYEKEVLSSITIDLGEISTESLFYRIETETHSLFTGKLINLQ